MSRGQALLSAFLAAAAPLLAPNGEVHITLVHRYPYTAWLRAVRDGEAAARLRYLGAAPFAFDAYPGYRHQATSKGVGSAESHLDVATRCHTHAWAPAAEATAPGPAPTVSAGVAYGAGGGGGGGGEGAPSKRRKLKAKKRRAAVVESRC